jgi:ABC-type dipeptide/oligopeptide/nickel transport system permease subunit
MFGPILAPHPPNVPLETQYTDGELLSPPIKPMESDRYPFGTDYGGYDLLSKVLYGIRYTIGIALAVTILKMFFGTVIGLYAGTLKRTPSWMVAFENTWSYVPIFLVLYFFLLPINFNEAIDTSTLVLFFIVITTMVSIPSIVSSIRKKTQEEYKYAYIDAAKTLGANRHRLIWKHIFPQMKESLLVMFLLEIVYVITIMGQLALVNIFVGGTKVTYDPILYHSQTLELAGLVGQSRDYIYGNTHILITPLIVLLFTTIGFSLLANGLKNRFQSTYQRTPWIRTGHAAILKPVRKAYGKQAMVWPLTGEKLAMSCFILLFITAGSYVYMTKDDDVGVKNGSKAKYDLSLRMNEEGEFTTNASIEVKNHSNDSWEDIVFYFIPNVFREGHSFKSVKGSAQVNIQSVKANGVEQTYDLTEDTFTIKLTEELKKRDKATVEITYSFTVPEEGNRFSKVDENYYLAQWYPMLATYQGGKWNKGPYSEGVETYHTDFSDFRVAYELPAGYSIVSTADKDGELEQNKGTVKMKKVRDYFIAIIKDMKVYETEVDDGVKIRLFAKEDHDKDPDQALEIAKDALSFYQQNIGEYPHQQLDIVFDDGPFMEYPGIVTVNPYVDDDSFFELSIVHEIAHQYFYGVVSNDSYHEGWIDEGITEFATSLYYFVGKNQRDSIAFSLPRSRMKRIEELELGRQHSNVTVDELKHTGYLYGQPAIEIYQMILEKYRNLGDHPKEVAVAFLQDYYEHFKYKEVDTEEFVSFSKAYFEVPTDYFNNWLDTKNVQK